MHDGSSFPDGDRYGNYAMQDPGHRKEGDERALHNGHEFSDHFIGCLLGRNIRIERTDRPTLVFLRGTAGTRTIANRPLRQDTQANRGHPENQSWHSRWIDWLNPQPGLLFHE